MTSLNNTWHHLTSLNITWLHLTSLYITLHHFIHHFTSLYITLHHFTSLYITWHHLKSLDITWYHLTLHSTLHLQLIPTFLSKIQPSDMIKQILKNEYLEKLKRERWHKLFPLTIFLTKGYAHWYLYGILQYLLWCKIFVKSVAKKMKGHNKYILSILNPMI